MIDLLFLHDAGLGWDEALVVFGGLGLLTSLLLTRLRASNDSRTDELEPEPARETIRD